MPFIALLYVAVGLLALNLAGCGGEDQPGDDIPGLFGGSDQDGRKWDRADQPKRERVPHSDQLPGSITELNLFVDDDPFSPESYLVPFDVRVTLWSDGLVKNRYLYLPDGQTISFDETAGSFRYPVGTLFVKQFYKTDAGVDEPIETRVMRMEPDGRWQFANYTWVDGVVGAKVASETDLKDQDGELFFRIPDEEACEVCHDDSRNLVLGFRPEQLAMVETGLDTTALAAVFDDSASTAIAAAEPLPDPYDDSIDLDLRMRSYFEVNCASCHNPQGEEPFFDLSFAATREESDLIQKEVINIRDLSDSDIRESLLPTSRETSKKYFERMSPATVSSDPLMGELLLPWLETWQASDDQQVDQVEKERGGRGGDRDRDRDDDRGFGSIFDWD